MAEQDSSEERTEEASTQRREDFRKRGQVAQSRELASVLVLFGTALLLWFLGRFFLEQVVELMSTSITDFVVKSARQGAFLEAGTFVITKAIYLVGPIFLVSMVLGLLSSIAQVGFIYNEDALQFDFNKINPVNGLRRLFSLTAVVEGLKAFLKVCLVMFIAVMIIKSDVMNAPMMIQYGTDQIMLQMGSTVSKLLFGIGFFMAVLTVFDYGYQWWDLEKKMMMTKQEVKEEHKSREGDPLIKARIRRIQREMANKRMMEDVPKADVVITNPTHIAVALSYSSEEMAAPKIVAMGADILAEKIRNIAKEHGVPLVENKPLARTIYKTLKVGQFIPRELFNAVAEVLAYVYRLKRKLGKS